MCFTIAISHADALGPCPRLQAQVPLISHDNIFSQHSNCLSAAKIVSRLQDDDVSYPRRLQMGLLDSLRIKTALQLYLWSRVLLCAELLVPASRHTEHSRGWQLAALLVCNVLL